MRRISALLPVFAATVLFATSAIAATLVVISGPTPYAKCSNDNQPGTVYVNAEVEPFVSVNPATLGTSHVNVIGVWQQDRWSNGGAHGLVAGFSFDGGSKWSETRLPFSACTPGAIPDPFTLAPCNRASDPWVSIGPDGTTYTVGLLATNTKLGPSLGDNDTGVATLTSTDGGQTWTSPNVIKADQGTSPIFEVTQFFNDKEPITADPLSARVAYVVWDRLVTPSGTLQSELRSRAFEGPTWFSKTTDGGKS